MIDALCGYLQILLAEEDQPLTTFIMPYGYFAIGPMGDAFCLRGDMALQGMTNCVKVIDYVLLSNKDYLMYLCYIDEVLSLCRKHNIT